MVLSFHKYGNFNNEGAIRHFLDLRDQYNIPLWMGESGENSNTWFTEAIRLVENHDIGWAWWQEKKMGLNNPLEIKETPAYRQLLEYWNGRSTKPSANAADSLFQELLQNIKLENCIYHKDVTDAMFRQVNSDLTQPFLTHRVTANTTINAADYDLGRQGFAYYDRDTASYHYTPGVNTIGNRGYTYRNDGVDIQAGSNGYYVFSIQDGEWLQYTVNVEKKGKYTVGFRIAATSDTGRISFLANDASRIQDFPVPNTGGPDSWQTISVHGILLDAGANRLKVYARKGGFELASIQLTK
jgi:hypothetical protein